MTRRVRAGSASAALASSALAIAGLAAALACARATRPPEPVPPAAAAAVIVAPEAAAIAASAPTPPAAEAAIAEPTPTPSLAVPEEPLQALDRTAPARVRIGLATDLDLVSLDCCPSGARTEPIGPPLVSGAPLVVRPAAAATGVAVYRLQVAALKDEGQATELARRLGALAGAPADGRLDAATGLYRVRLGRYPTRPAAESAGRSLARSGLDSFWVVSEGGGVADPALEVEQRGAKRRVAGARFALESSAGGAVRFDGVAYRGRLEVVLNARGRLNVVNELPLEEYLRGVVPRELGPGLYPEIEALKAQAIAARTYTIRNLGDFVDEGFDLCATPRCQVYGGRDAEHPLSDRAVLETAGEVLVWSGGESPELVDALYTATCGGHTENVEVIFPLKRAPYLRGVPCAEAEPTRLAGGRGGAFPRDLLIALLPDLPASLADPRAVATAGAALAALAGAPADDPRLRDLEASPSPAAAGTSATDVALTRLLSLALRLGLLEERWATFARTAGEKLLVREGSAVALYDPPRTRLFLSDGGRIVGHDLDLVAGDPLRLYLAGGRLLGMIQEARAGAPRFEHDRSRWSKFRSDAEIASDLRSRFPGFSYRGFDVLSRGVSGRVGKMRFLGAGGETVDVEGLAVRWTLDLPDTWFTLRRVAPKGGTAGWQFTGRGWGHGVGLCQTGSFNLARRGRDAAEILAHYYTGTHLEILHPGLPSAR